MLINIPTDIILYNICNFLTASTLLKYKISHKTSNISNDFLYKKYISDWNNKSILWRSKFLMKTREKWNICYILQKKNNFKNQLLMNYQDIPDNCILLNNLSYYSNLNIYCWNKLGYNEGIHKDNNIYKIHINLLTFDNIVVQSDIYIPKNCRLNDTSDIDNSYIPCIHKNSQISKINKPNLQIMFILK